MGGMVGLTIGFLFGTFAILRSGAGPRGFLPSLSGYMLTSGATFAFFMSIGTVIRTQDMTLTHSASSDVRGGRRLVGTAPIGTGTLGWKEWERRRKALEKGGWC